MEIFWSWTYLSVIQKTRQLTNTFGWLLWLFYVEISFLFVCLFVFYGMSSFVGYLMANQFLKKQTVLFQTIQFGISTQFNSQKHFSFKLFNLDKQSELKNLVKYKYSVPLNVKAFQFRRIQFSVSTISISKTVLFQVI